MIPTCEPFITPEDRRAVDAALKAGHAAVGPEVEEFEQAVAERVGLPHAVAVTSGSVALHLALQAFGVRFGWRVKVPTLAFTALAEAVVHCGAEPEFVDHGHGAFVSLAFYGHPALPGQVEDACEALGSQPIGRSVLTCLSFNGNKIITAGGGGMVLTRDPQLALRVRRLACHERSDPVEWLHSGVGYNARLSAFQAALGLSQLRRLDEHITRKRETAEHYASGLPAGVTMLGPSEGTSNYWMPVVLLYRPARPVIDALLRDGIGARPLWTPLHRQVPYLGYRHGPVPAAEDLWLRGLVLPCSVGITPEERETVLAGLRRALGTGTPDSTPPS